MYEPWNIEVLLKKNSVKLYAKNNNEGVFL